MLFRSHHLVFPSHDTLCCSISGTKTVKGIVLDTQDDAYTPKGIGDDSGVDVASFVLKVMHAST